MGFLQFLMLNYNGPSKIFGICPFQYYTYALSDNNSQGFLYYIIYLLEGFGSHRNLCPLLKEDGIFDIYEILLPVGAPPSRSAILECVKLFK